MSNYARKIDADNLSRFTKPLLKRPVTSEGRPPKFMVVYHDQEGKCLKVPTVIGLRGPNFMDAQKALGKMIHRGQILPRYRNGIKVIKNPEYDDR